MSQIKIPMQSHLADEVEASEHLHKFVPQERTERKAVVPGARFGWLTVISRLPNDKRGHPIWLCECDCGKKTAVLALNLPRGNTKSCGCYRKAFVSQTKRTHGQCRTNLYSRWASMIQRCFDKAHRGFKNYGARGITVCERWLHYENFAADMGYPPKGASLGRIDNDGPYAPNNCRWEQQWQQMRNTRMNKFITHAGKSLTIADWAEIAGMPYKTLWNRLNLGWSFEAALTRPLRAR